MLDRLYILRCRSQVTVKSSERGTFEAIQCEAAMAQKKYFFVFCAIFFSLIGLLAFGAWHTHRLAGAPLGQASAGRRAPSEAELDRSSPPPALSEELDTLKGLPRSRTTTKSLSE